jgi:hypothetical protein
MVSQIIKNKKRPGKKLARRIAYVVCTHELHQDAMYFYLRGMHRDYDNIAKECPDAFKDFRATRDRKDDEGLRIC